MSVLLQDPIRVQSVLKGFLLLAKQLQVFKESWARRRLGAQTLRTPSFYQQFVKLYRYGGKLRKSEDFVTFRQLYVGFLACVDKYQIAATNIIYPKNYQGILFP